MIYVIIGLIAYLLGSVNSSIFLSKLIEKKDVRTLGSGNAGFTNTLRNFKKSTAVFVLLGDVLKAVIAFLIAKLICPDDRLALYITGICVTLGHNFPIYFGFKGGKGILVSEVSALFFDWKAGLVALLIFAVMLIIFHYVSLAALSGVAGFFVVTVIFYHTDIVYIAFSFVLCSLAFIMHRANIVRLINGTENPVFRKD